MPQTNPSQTPIPTQLNLHRATGVLDITFDDGRFFSLTAEYLRVFSPPAEVRGHSPGQWKWAFDKQRVKIEQIEPVGNYAVILHFDDGHNTGIYSWEELYKLGINHDAFWDRYLKAREEAGKPRVTDA